MQLNIEIKEITAANRSLFPDALELLNRTQGRDLFAPDYMETKTASGTAKVFGAFDKGILVGLGVAELIANVDYYLAFAPEISQELQGKIIGSFSTLCIHEDLQGKGIGQMISQKRLEFLESKHVPVILGISWVSGKAHTSNRVFEKMGFRSVKLVENFFYQSSIDRPFVCPGCGEPPCTCSAILYRKDY